MTMTIADAAQQQSAPREGLLARHPLVFFFLLANVFFWGYVWLILVPLNLPGPLFALGADGTVQLVELASGRRLHTFRGETHFTGLAFSPDSQTLAAVSDAPGPLRLWDLATKK